MLFPTPPDPRRGIFVSRASGTPDRRPRSCVRTGTKSPVRPLQSSPETPRHAGRPPRSRKWAKNPLQPSGFVPFKFPSRILGFYAPVDTLSSTSLSESMSEGCDIPTASQKTRALGTLSLSRESLGRDARHGFCPCYVLQRTTGGSGSPRALGDTTDGPKNFMSASTNSRAEGRQHARTQPRCR